MSGRLGRIAGRNQVPARAAATCFRAEEAEGERPMYKRRGRERTSEEGWMDGWMLWAAAPPYAFPAATTKAVGLLPSIITVP